jgi:hypothetical protein
MAVEHGAPAPLVVVRHPVAHAALTYYRLVGLVRLLAFHAVSAATLAKWAFYSLYFPMGWPLRSSRLHRIPDVVVDLYHGGSLDARMYPRLPRELDDELDHRARISPYGRFIPIAAPASPRSGGCCSSPPSSLHRSSVLCHRAALAEGGLQRLRAVAPRKAGARDRGDARRVRGAYGHDPPSHGTHKARSERPSVWNPSSGSYVRCASSMRSSNGSRPRRSTSGCTPCLPPASSCR